uniref:Uncharacterized protein n=1 Tax=Acrobeloides nanus TaxID=290746 RepID=A0A914CQ98_9BILA
MSLIFKRSFHKTLGLNRGPLGFQGWYPKDHKPGPYPKTEEERRAAAIKYGLRPEDYKPLDQSDYLRSSGDYPNLDAEGAKANKYRTVNFDVRDPFENYTTTLFRRNFNEPVPREFVQMGPERITYTGLEDFQELNWKNILLNVVVFGAIFAFAFWTSQSNPDRFRYKNPAMPKEYPYDYYRAWPWQDPLKYPITNYTFEPEDK